MRCYTGPAFCVTKDHGAGGLIDILMPISDYVSSLDEEAHLHGIDCQGICPTHLTALAFPLDEWARNKRKHRESGQK
jgi:hypothetical protein